MGIGRLWTVSMLGAVLLGAAETVAQEQRAALGDVLEARIWLDRGVDPVLRRGDWARVYYRTSRDSQVSVFHIDTNGFMRVLHPGSPMDDHYALGERDYRVLFPESQYWHVDEDEGKGYLFIVASAAPLDFSGFAYARYGGGWDISAVLQAGYRDPFLMMDDIVEALIPRSWAAEFALDFVAYDIDHPHDYPRFLCYDCHGFIPMFDWNPYGHWCTDFRVVIHDDPYYYPVYRYRGDRVVYTRPLAPRSPMFELQERAGDEPATPLIRTRQGNESGMPGHGLGPGLTRRAAPEGELAPAARVSRLREPLRPAASERSDAAAPPAGAAPVEGSVRPGMRIPTAPAEPPPGAVEARMPVERADSVARPGPVDGGAAGRPLPGQPRAGVLAPITPGGGPPSPDAPARAAGDRPGMAVPAGDRGAEGRDERPVLRRRPEPSGADSTRRPTARPRTPPDGRPPTSGGRPPPTAARPPASDGRPPASAGRPPARPAGSPAAADPVRSPATPPSAARSGPPPRSSGPPSASAGRDAPTGPPRGSMNSRVRRVPRGSVGFSLDG